MKRLERILEMFALFDKKSLAMPKGNWQDRARSILTGAFGEYTKIHLAKLFYVDYSHWEREVQDHLYLIDRLMDSKRIKTRSDFDRYEAIAASADEASIDKEKVNKSKNQFIKKNIKIEKDQNKIDHIILNPKSLMEN